MKQKSEKVGMLVGVLAVAAGALAGPVAELREPLEWLYPDSKTGERPAFVETDVPANGVAEANVLVTGLEKGVPVKVGCVGGGEWFRLLDVPVEANTGLKGFTEKGNERNAAVTRRAPFRVFDAMEPLADGWFIPGATTAALRFRLRKLPGVGTAELKLKVAQGTFAAELPLRVNVHAAKVMPVGLGSFKYTNWMSFPAMASWHGLKQWSEEHWRMIEKYAAMAAYARQNMVLLQLGLFMRVENGKVVVDEERLKRFVSIFEAVGIRWIEGGHICTFTGGSWSARSFDVRLFGKRTTTPEGEAGIAAISKEIVRLIDKYGWRDRWIQHVADEPSRHNSAEYLKTCAIVRKYLPGVKFVDAVETEELPNAIDIWCPKDEYYQLHRQAFEDYKKAGDEVWCYTCCIPGGKWMNRLLDNELMRPLLLPWGCERFKLAGFLHWGYNQYMQGVNPLQQSITGDWHLGQSLPAGDRNIVYPGQDGPWPSIRLEAQRQGTEDLELLRQLAGRDSAKAEKLIGELVRGFDDYETDPAKYWAVRRRLLDALD